MRASPGALLCNIHKGAGNSQRLPVSQASKAGWVRGREKAVPTELIATAGRQVKPESMPGSSVAFLGEEVVGDEIAAESVGPLRIQCLPRRESIMKQVALLVNPFLESFLRRRAIRGIKSACNCVSGPDIETVQ
jgi:hypothetical protein